MPSVREQILDAIELLYGGPAQVVRSPVVMNIEEVKSSGFLRAMVPGEETVSKAQHGVYDIVMEVNIEQLEKATVSAGTDFRTRAAERSKQCERVLGDIKRVVATTRGNPTAANLGGLVTIIDYSGGQPVEPEERHNAVGAAATFIVRYQSSITDPDATTREPITP